MASSATNFSDYPHAEPGSFACEPAELPAEAQDAQNAQAAAQAARIAQTKSAITPRRPRPIVCIADGCVCSFASDEDYEAGIPRDRLPMGCAAL